MAHLGASLFIVAVFSALLLSGCVSSTTQVDGCAETTPVAASPSALPAPPVATFSIIAFDPVTNELGVAVQSKFIAVGAVVPFAKAGVGAIATQSYANTTYGPAGLALLAEGVAPADVVKRLTTADEDRDHRQLGIINATGEAATFTGAKCNAWAGGRTGKNYAVQGNILAGENVITAMAESFEKSEGDLAERLIAALAAGQVEGGDTRGMQSAALLIVRDGWGYAGLNDRYRDLRVDDHEKPIEELRRIYDLHRKVFPRPKPPKPM
jgi:uncharacterized Ntn-hydrolase superfamily protein